MSGGSRPDVTVVVPTRNRPTPLARCLASLARQEGVAMELLVVDDGSADGTPLARLVSAWPKTRVITSGGRGPAAARNLGARSALARLVAFTDDDCEPHPGWAAALVRRLEHGATVVAGATVNARPGDPFADASQLITTYLMHHGQQGFAPSNNVACRREVALAFPFDETYPEAAGEDRDWALRLQAAGQVLEVEEAAVVVHRQELGWVGFARQQLRYGRGARAFRKRSRSERAGRLPAAFYLGLVRAGFSHGPAVGALVVLSQALVLIGYSTGPRRRRGCGPALEARASLGSTR